MKWLLISAVLAVLLLGNVGNILASTSKITSEDAEAIIRKRADETIEVLKNKDFYHLSRLVHPDKGLRLSQYSFLWKNGVVLRRREITKLSSNQKRFLNVLLGESGNSEDLTFNEFYNRYIFDHDYSKAPEVNFNRTISRGSEGNNLFSFFPESIIAEYHFPGIDPKREGMDWKSLYLVFEKAVDSNWYLVCIAHAEKTE